ncbi:MAG: peptide-methionine (S)-S-oxide reductase MsrA [Candidatus Pacebacteria bacterium]|nr:peptide-methionine (S)-S-oxide reductase MsrA [Candidatus Paceibacterota bacterium]
MIKEIAVFGGGCFWCTEAVFKMLDGVESVTSGYAGGHTENPTYEEVCTGTTGHAESIRIEYDPAKVSYNTLLTIFFATHDATQLNRQGNDVGTQYRSIILYTTDEQKMEAKSFISELEASSSEGDPIVTEVVPLITFYEAESYHQDYFEKNPQQSYCQIIIAPKLQKVQEKYAELLKKVSS